MKKRHGQESHRKGSAEPRQVRTWADRLRPVWLGGMTAVLVATPFVPCEHIARVDTSLVLVLAWLALLVAWALTGWLTGRMEARIDPVFVALVIFVVCHSVSALVMAGYGQPRAALNLAWLWVSFALAFFLARQWLRTAAECRALASVMIALGVCLSVYGYYQYFYEMPKARRAYRANPEAELEKAGIDAPAGSATRSRFEDRLLRSREPTATFSLTNSLAGFLTPWLLAVLGIAMGNWRSKSLDRSFVAVCGVSAIIMVGCWILTKSRTAWLATAMGVALLGLQAWRRGWRMPSWKITAFVVVGLALVAASVTAIGGLDKLVLTESQKSLAYRFEYWRASWAMIADHPWLGCGPGNFQQYYTKYKLPEASEEISDPHNFVLEVWATAGTPAVIAFVAMLAVFAWQAWHILNETTSAEAERPSADQGTTRSDSGGRAPRAALHAAPSETAEGSVRSVYWGALGGVLFAYFPCGFLVDIMPSSALLVVAVPFTALVLALWNGWTTRGELPTSALVVCIVGLLVNLLAAGGISFAGVSMSLWLLMALTLHPSNQSTPPRPMGRFAGLTLVLSALALSMTYVVTQWQPVLTRSALLAQGERDWREGRADHAERSFVEATAADPLDVEPWMNLAALRHQRWLQTVDPQSWKGFETAAQSMLARSRRSSALHERYGDWLLAAYRRTNDKQHLRDAIGAYRRAVELYPNHSLTRAQCAWALSLANDVEEARTGAEEAIRLDSLHMHREQKLAVVPLFDPGLPDGERNAEHLMHKLRNAKRT